MCTGHVFTDTTGKLREKAHTFVASPNPLETAPELDFGIQEGKFEWT